MKSHFLLLLGILLCACVQGQFIAPNLEAKMFPAQNGNINFGFLEFKPKTYTTNGPKHPLIIAIHGLGDWGDGTTNPDTDPNTPTGAVIGRVLKGGIPQLIFQGASMTFTLYNKTESFVVLMPQLNNSASADPSNPGPWQPFYIQSMIDYAKQNLNIDANRIFLNGYSYGGGGSWMFPISSLSAAQQMAGVLPVCSVNGGDATTLATNVELARVGVLAIHADDDVVAPAGTSINYVNAINGRNPAIRGIRFRSGLTGNHDIYKYDPNLPNRFYVYDTTNRFMYPNIYQWMLGVNRANLAGLPGSNNPPVADVGPGGTNVNVVVTPKRYLMDLDARGSYDDKDVIVSYRWELIGMSNGATAAGIRQQDNYFQQQSFPVEFPLVKLAFEKLGTYTFRLTLTDLYGAQTVVNKVVNLTSGGVNVPPSVDLGPDVTLADIASNTFSYFVFGSIFDWEGHTTFFDVEGGWEVVGTPPSQTLTFPFDYIGTIGGINEIGDYVVRYRIRNKVNANPPGGNGSPSLSDFSYDTLVITQARSLPARLQSFTGRNLGRLHELQWATGEEIGVEGFDIEHSVNGRDYQVVGFVAAQMGNSRVVRTYRFRHESVPVGKSYYRLKMKDRDGKFQYSNIIVLVSDQGKMLASVFPNPVKDQAVIQMEGDIRGEIQVRLTNVNGQLLQRATWQKNNQLLEKIWSTQALQKGTYWIELSQGTGYRQVFQIIKE